LTVRADLSAADNCQQQKEDNDAIPEQDAVPNEEAIVAVGKHLCRPGDG
jgi:hypothetical protein